MYGVHRKYLRLRLLCCMYLVNHKVPTQTHFNSGRIMLALS